MGTINIQVLADTLKISKSTVSKALRDSHEISNETKKKVIELAATLNYSPNPYASSLRKKKSKTIAVVLPEVADSFFSRVINGIQSVAEKKGYHVLIYLSHEKYNNEKNNNTSNKKTFMEKKNRMEFLVFLKKFVFLLYMVPKK